MQVSKKSQYGLRAMIYLAKFFKQKKISSIKEISDEENIPFDFLEKIISQLEKEKLVKAKRGARGGYFLAKKPERITAGKIFGILEKTTKPVNCLGCQRIKGCSSKAVWGKIEKSINKTLELIKLSSLI